MRVDANVSVNRAGEPWGTRCEIKNLNSLRSLGRAIDHEALRQIDLLESGETVRQETRHWDEAAGRTGTLRVKEDADDYRYFPEPDLVPLEPDRRGHRPHRRRAAGAARRPPRGAGRRRRASSRPTAAVAIAVDRGLDDLALAAIAAGADAGRVLTHVEHNLAVDGAESLSAEHLAALVTMETGGELTATQAKTVLAEVVATGSSPADVAKAHGFEALDTGALEAHRRRRHRRAPRRVGAAPHRRRQGPGQAHRLLHGQGDEGHQGPSRRQGRHRPPPLQGRPLTPPQR